MYIIKLYMYSIYIYLFLKPSLLEGPFVSTKATTKTAGHGTSKGPALILVKRFRLEPVLDERSKLCTLPWLENQLANETNRKCYVTLNDLKKSIKILVELMVSVWYHLCILKLSTHCLQTSLNLSTLRTSSQSHAKTPRVVNCKIRRMCTIYIYII